MRKVAVAFCADKLMEAPLHVAAFSLLSHLHPECIPYFYFMLSEFSEKDKQRLERTLKGIGRPHVIEFLDPPAPQVFNRFLPLHGNYTPYHRLLLPEMIPDRLLYLDTDVEVNIDVAPLFDAEMGTKPMGAVLNSTVRFAFDHRLRLALGASPDDPAFNSGCLLFNPPEWRRQNCFNRIMDFCADHREELTSHDQSVLNALFAKDCFPLDVRYNARPGAQESIVHFVGSPKPWDIGGRFIVPGASGWYRTLGKTAASTHPWASPRAWSRMVRILGGYRHALETRLRP